MATSRPGGLSSEDVRRKKTSFTLDFGQSSAAAAESVAAKKAKQDLLNEGVLRSPDVSLLALATPDLERLILQQTYGAAAAAAAATTPPGAAAATAGAVTTPTQILFPRSVTEEQEAYARGFIDALLELQRQQQKVVSSPHLQVVPDPRTGLFMPIASPSEEGLPSLYSPITRVVQPTLPLSTSAATSISSLESGRIAVPLIEYIPTQITVPVLRPGTLNLPGTVSPTIAPRRSAVVPNFSRKQFLPLINDCETLDLSPSGRNAMRKLEHSVEVEQKTVQQPIVIKPVEPIVSSTEANAKFQQEVSVVDNNISMANHKRPEPPNDPAPAVHVPLALTTSPTLSEPSQSVPISTSLPIVTSVTSVPSVPLSVTSALPTRPIDMSFQEQAKIERKREKNRYAAQKCRMLKLERIAHLEKRVADLKEQNEALAGKSGQLREDVTQLKQLIVQHVDNGGCQIMPLHNLQSTMAATISVTAAT